MASQNKRGKTTSNRAERGRRGPYDPKPGAARPSREEATQEAPPAADGTRPGGGAPYAQPRRAERRPDVVRQRREERLRYQERQARQRLLLRIGGAVVALLVAVAVVFLVVDYLEGRDDDRIPDGVQTYSNTAGHVNPGEAVTYAEVPPTGGEHDPTWQNCGYYAAPVRNENGVHSLEHGAVWITYRPDLPADQVEVLRELADDSYILVSPYPDLPSPVVVSSWNKQLQLDSANNPDLEQFIRIFKQGPDTPEPGARCDGGTSATV